eukprot:c11199_g1_i1.p1 GENE.c11199_g1_i1~~c11199_g1_i1.p1  ORF type:complete len:311 (+),score=40.92 c11199_g1_i1:44-934(+)
MHSHNVLFPDYPQQPTTNSPQIFTPNSTPLNSLTSDPQMAAAVNLGLGMGSKMLEEGMGKAHQGISRYVTVRGIKYYFQVNNSYVANKLKLLAWPFQQKQWERLTVDGDLALGEGGAFRPPRDDVFAPDLYIPSMAFCTYVLLVCLVLGMKNQFTPETLGMAASSALATVGFEVGVLKLALYLVDVNVPILDLISYCSYTFVGIDYSMVLGIVGGYYLYWFSLTASSLTCAYSLTRMLKSPVMKGPIKQTSLNSSHEQKRQRQYLLLGFAVLQLLVSWFLGVPPNFVTAPPPSALP